MKKFINLLKEVTDYIIPKVVGIMLILALILFGFGTFLVALKWVLGLLGVM